MTEYEYTAWGVTRVQILFLSKYDRGVMYRCRYNAEFCAFRLGNPTFSTAITHAALMKLTPSCMSLIPAALAISSSDT